MPPSQAASCAGKKPFSSPSSARRELRQYTARWHYHPPIQIYHCRFCGGWHMGAGASAPKLRDDAKQFKNWHWREAVLDC